MDIELKQIHLIQLIIDHRMDNTNIQLKFDSVASISLLLCINAIDAINSL